MNTHLARLIALAFLTLFSLSTHAAPLADLSGEPLEPPARKIPIAFQCNFRFNSSELCQRVIQGFFADYGSHFEDAKGLPAKDERIVRLKLTDQSAPNNQTTFFFAWKAKRSVYNAQDLNTEVNINRSLDLLTHTQLLIQEMVRGAAFYLKIESATLKDGYVAITFGEESEGSAGNGSTDSPFAFELGGSFWSDRAEFNSESQGSLNGTINYSTPRVRAILGGNARYRQMSVTSTDGKVTGDNTSTFERMIVSYSSKPVKPGDFTGPWSVALIGMHERNPGANVQSDLSGMVGLEGSLVPYRISENKELIVRIGAGAGRLDLNDENSLGHFQENYGFTLAQLYTYWVLGDSKFSVNSSATVVINLNYKGYESYALNTGLNYQITQATRVGIRGKFNYQAESMSVPRNPDFSNIVRSTYLPSKGLTQHFQITFSATLKNAIRNNRDQRWRNF